MEQTNVQITQDQPTLTVEIVQNLIPVMTAHVTVGGGSGPAPVFGDTLTGTGTPSDPVNVSDDILDQINNNTQTAQDNASQIEEIQALIPATANQNNPLADQGFVNSSIQTATAYFRGDWATWADVPSDPELYPVDATGNHTPTTNDYMVVIADEQTNGGTWRYKYTGLWSEQGKSGWQAEYQVNETPFTAAQNAAINSGVTAQAVADISANKAAVANLQTSKQNKLTAGTGITIEGDTISADGGGGGDYLPTTGGTGDGEYVFKRLLDNAYTVGKVIVFAPYTTSRELTKISIQVGDGYMYVGTNNYIVLSGTSRYLRPDTDDRWKLGTSGHSWQNVYTKKLNNGADLEVPTEGGTLARVEDINAAVGDISTALTAILGE